LIKGLKGTNQWALRLVKELELTVFDHAKGFAGKEGIAQEPGGTEWLGQVITKLRDPAQRSRSAWKIKVDRRQKAC
jgi:hypothetical protein